MAKNKFLDSTGLSYVWNKIKELMISKSDIGVANGVATLDNEGKVPASQLPEIVDYDSILNDSKEYTDSVVNELIGTSPENLNTIHELASAIQNEQSVVDAIEESITNKVDKVLGKGLSTNDYTTEDKTKLNELGTIVDNIIDGETPVGNSNKLNGLNVNEIAQNPNLLKNSNFALNTNGLTEYVNHVNMICVDEWKCEGASIVTPLYPGLQVQHTSAVDANLISQTRKELLPSVKGKTVTISCKYSNRSLDDKFFIALWDGVNYVTEYADDTATEGTLILTTNISADATTLNITFVKSGTSTTFTVDVEWVKLEIGSLATEYIAKDIEVEKVECGLNATTADLVNYLPKSGGTVKGGLNVNNGYVAMLGSPQDAYFGSLEAANDYTNARFLGIFNKTALSDINRAVVLRDIIDNVTTDYILFHSGNSAPVVITEDSTTPPSDTNALWVY